jgi:4-hydroxy 2-oxovalerate aldolase
MDVPIPSAPKILECTLRDGSFAVDFQFSAEDTTRIARRLDSLGFPYIEVGHGIGLGASGKGMGTSAATDEEYCLAAASAVTRGQWGMVCISGIAEPKDLDMAASHGMGFARIVATMMETEAARALIERARHRGLFVLCTFRKTCASPAAVFAREAQKCVGYGAQCVYIVDGTGGMLPGEIGSYIDALREVTPTAAIGFHGQNNLGMGVANALHCAGRRVDVLDASLQGIGRSAGNTPTGQLVAALSRAGYEHGLDPIDIMQAGEELIRPLLIEAGISSLDVAAGLARFHSSYMRRVLAAAKEYHVDPRRLILAICARDRVNAPPAVIEEAAREVQRLHAPLSPLLARQYFEAEPAYFGDEEA